MSDGPADAGALLPHDEERCIAQVQGVLALLGSPPRRVLDLGCGAGRVLGPLARAGHDVTGVDRDPAEIAACRAALASSDVEARLVEADVIAFLDAEATRFDVVLCLGNTLMTFPEVDAAVHLMRAAGARLADGGMLLLDDMPQDLWPELTSGRWQAGLSEDGSMQLVWADDDAVFAIRTGAAVDPGDWSLRPGERRLRLWTMGALRLAAARAGLSAPAHCAGEGLLVLRRPVR